MLVESDLRILRFPSVLLHKTTRLNVDVQGE